MSPGISFGVGYRGDLIFKRIKKPNFVSLSLPFRYLADVLRVLQNVLLGRVGLGLSVKVSAKC